MWIAIQCFSYFSSLVLLMKASRKMFRKKGNDCLTLLLSLALINSLAKACFKCFQMCLLLFTV